MKKRILAMTLSVMMLVSPITANASNQDLTETETEETLEESQIEEIETEPETDLIISEEKSAVKADAEEEVPELRTADDVEITGLAADGVEQFVERLYRVCLGREADLTGRNYWSSRIKNNEQSAAEVVWELFNSMEYSMQKKSDAGFVEDIYITVFNRASDDAGKSYWLSVLDNGVSRDYIIKDMLSSTEFNMLCTSYGIVPGTLTIAENRDQNYDATRFVQRMYRICFGRNGDPDGLNYWTGGLINGTGSGASVARNFFESQEYQLWNKSNDAYVADLYTAIMDRTLDEEGKAYWLGVLQSGKSRSYVLAEFLRSEEFKLLCASYGIKVENLTEAEARIQEHINSIYAVTGKDLNACYWWVVNNMSYQRRNGHLVPPSGYTRDQWYAVLAYETRVGNCYSYAAAYYHLVKGMGYEAQYIEGQVTAARGGYTPHAWVNIKIDGAWYICDPEAQDEIKGGYNFYMQPIGSTVLSYIW